MIYQKRRCHPDGFALKGVWSRNTQPALKSILADRDYDYACKTVKGLAFHYHPYTTVADNQHSGFEVLLLGTSQPFQPKIIFVSGPDSK